MNKNLQEVLIRVAADPLLSEKHLQLSEGPHTDVIAFLKECAKSMELPLEDEDFLPETGRKNPR